jgi:hypothetical protein
VNDFFNTSKIADEEVCKARWSCGKPGEFFRCALCGHRFVPGDAYTLVYTNDIPKTNGNPICCSSHGTIAEMREQYRALCEEFRTTESDKFWFFHKHRGQS